jgi:hypothetical protein
MVYKPEHVVDLETGAIVDADVRAGDEHDFEELTERILEAEDRMNKRWVTRRTPSAWRWWRRTPGTSSSTRSGYCRA